jgi:hypothetical protein
MTQHPELAKVGQLILVRLLAGGEKGATLTEIKKSLDPLLQHRWSGGARDELLDQALAHLASAGWVLRTRKGRSDRSTLTPEGRQTALQFLALEELPPRTTWDKLKKTYLQALALGLPVPGGAAAGRFATDTGFKAALLKDQFALPLDPYPTLPQAADALAWKLLGFDSKEKFTLGAVKRAVFNRALGGHPQADDKKALNQLLAQAVEARRDDANELRLAAFRRWLDQGQAAPEPLQTDHAPGEGAPVDLPTFARTILEAARSSLTGWFGNNKVFIAHVWRAVQDSPALWGLDFDAFKRKLGEANQARLLDLSRADLVEAMDPEDVRASETRYLGAIYHFVRIDEAPR